MKKLLIAMLATTITLIGCAPEGESSSNEPSDAVTSTESKETTTSTEIGSSMPNETNETATSQINETNKMKITQASETWEDGYLPQFADPESDTPIVTLSTTEGDIKIMLFPQAAPLTVENFVTHAENGYYSNNIYEVRESEYAMWGGLLFVGLLLSTIFLVATILIIYYKQISEGYEDKLRYKIIYDIGIDQKLAKKSIDKQILIMFFLPIVSAIIHTLFASPLILKLIGLQGFNSNPLYFKVMTLVSITFFLIYSTTYFITTKIYYKILIK